MIRLRLTARLFWTGAVLILLGVHCAKKDSPLGIDLPNEGEESMPQTVTLIGPEVDTYAHSKLSLTYASNLLTGDHDGIRTRSLFKFNFSGIDSLDEISKAVFKVVMHDTYPRSDAAIAHMHYLVPISPADSAWTPLAATWSVRDTTGASSQIWTRPGVVDEATFRQDAFASVSIGTTADTNYVEVEFDITAWLRAQAPEDSASIQDFVMMAEPNIDISRHFYTVGSAASPKIIAYFNQNVDSLVFSPMADVSIVEEIQKPKISGSEPFFQIHNGYFEFGLLKFSWPDSLVDININYAKLELSIDPSRTDVNPSAMTLEIKGLNIETMQDSAGIDMLTVSPDSIQISSTSLAAGTVDPTAASFTFTNSLLNRYVQDWADGDLENFGLLIRGKNYADDLQHVAFYTGEAGQALAPRLKIVYTRPTARNFTQETQMADSTETTLNPEGGR